jgi:heme exporter protein C
MSSKHPLILFIHKLGSAPHFYGIAGHLIPWLWAIFLILAAIGTYWGLFRAPPDYLQGESARIMYVHVPSAWMSMMIYALMAAMGFIALVWRIRMVEVLMISDARLTSELVLLFLYLGAMGLHSAIDEPRKAARATSLLVLVGVINLPIIHYSVEWWNTLHQPASIGVRGSSIDPSMLWPLLIMAIAAKFFYGANLLTRARLRLIEQDRRKNWVQKILERKNLGS